MSPNVPHNPPINMQAEQPGASFSAAMVRWLWVLAAATVGVVGVWLVVGGLYATHAGLSSAALVQVQAQVQAQELSQPDPSTARAADWQNIALPTKLCVSDCRSRYKLYRKKIVPKSNEAPALLYLPMFDGAAAVYLNGVQIAQSGSLIDPFIDTTYQPLVADIPAHLWRADINTLQVLVASVLPRGGRLLPFYLGSAESVGAAANYSRILTIVSLELLLGVVAVLALCALLVYSAGDRDPIYLWFIGLLALIALRCAGVVFPGWPVDVTVRHGLYLAATLGVLFTSAGFVSRLANRLPSRLDLALLALWLPLGLVCLAALYVDFWGNWAWANRLVGITAVGLGSWILIRFLLHARRLPPTQHAALSALLLMGLLLLLHDVWFVLQQQILVFQLSNLAAVPIMAAFCVALATRYGKHVQSVQAANQRLEAAVSETRLELDTTHKRLRVHAEQQTLQRERKRLLQDVHDGVGGRLAALAQRLRFDTTADTQTATELEESVQDLRLIINSLDEPVDQPIGFALGAFREQAKPWLQQHGVSSNWQLPVASLSARVDGGTLSICRILQEALNNVVRHSQSATVAIAAAYDDEQLSLVVVDRGIGLPAKHRSGRGLRIMQSRAAELGGRLSVESTDEGVRVALLVPARPTAAQ